VLELIRQQGGRASTASRVVIEFLTAAQGRHRTVDQLAVEIHAEHPEIHQTTVYRNLERLEALGVAYHTHLGHGPAQWHLANSSHPHLTCEHCGSVVEVPGEVFTSLQDALLANVGFRADLRHFALTGTCRACRTARGT
jgi:Fe2+ or Zn2+ uptake regulation protein